MSTEDFQPRLNNYTCARRNFLKRIIVKQESFYAHFAEVNHNGEDDWEDDWEDDYIYFIFSVVYFITVASKNYMLTAERGETINRLKVIPNIIKNTSVVVILL